MSRPRDSIATVVAAVIFDFYGTLAHWADGPAPNYEAVFAAHGYSLEPAVLAEYFSRYDGVDHADHSVSEEAYEAWVRTRLRDLTNACGVDGSHVEGVIDALREWIGAGWWPIRKPGRRSRPCRGGGGRRRLLQLGMGARRLPPRGGPAPSGRRRCHLGAGRGSRTPPSTSGQPRRSALDPRHVLFVGDSWEPDVRGPRRMGMTAVHVWRSRERSGQSAPALEAGDHRVGELTGVLDLLGLPPPTIEGT